MIVKPLRDMVHVEPKKKETKTAAGLFLPGDEKSSNFGNVIAVGPGKLYSNGQLIPTTVQPGQDVYYSELSGINLPDGTMLIPESEILAIVKF